MARFLITGGAGFVGMHLSHALTGAGHEVDILDNLSTGRRANLAPGVRFHESDINNTQLLRDVLQEIDGVYHLAAVSSVQTYLSDWTGSARVNLGGTLSVFSAAADANVPVVYASSAAIYGAATDLPIREDSQPNPISGYGADKLSGEYHARAMAEAAGLNSVGLRFFNIYGPGQSRQSAYTGVITIFLDRWLSGDSVLIYGDGTQTRDFIYVGDVVQALMRAMTHAQAGHSDVFNICAGTSVSVRDLADGIGRITGRALSYDFAPARPGEIHASCGCPDKAREILGFEAQTKFETGLAQLIDWFKAQDNAVAE